MGGRSKNLVFPPARIKRMMRSDKEVGKIAVSTPFLLSKALQLALEDFLTTAAANAKERLSSVITPEQLRVCVEKEQRFHYLKRIVQHIPLKNEEEIETNNAERKNRPSRKSRKTVIISDEEKETNDSELNKSISKKRTAKKSGTKGTRQRNKKSESLPVKNGNVEEKGENMLMESTNNMVDVLSGQEHGLGKAVKSFEVLETTPAKLSLQTLTREDDYDED